jgi:class 3 adenylate cyclase
VEIPGAVEDDRERQVLTSTMRSSPAPAILHPHAERRQLTVLSCDFVGSTNLSMRLDPEDLRDVMHVCQTVCARTIERLSGHVQTWQGDGVFVLFGYPRASEDDAPRAVHCAWEILQALAPARERFNREHGVRLAARSAP